MKTLVLISSGRDSKLAACRLIEKQHTVFMVHYDNGCISHSEHAGYAAQSILGKYLFTDERLHRWLGSFPIMPIFHRMLEPYAKRPIAETANLFPSIEPYQLCCLACRTAMYAASMALAKRYKLDGIADGVRMSQRFINQQPAVLQWFRTLLAAYQLDLHTPVFEIEDDKQVIDELTLLGFYPKGTETKCWAGMAAPEMPTEVAINSGLCYLELIRPIFDDAVRACSSLRPNDN